MQTDEAIWNAEYATFGRQSPLSIEQYRQLRRAGKTAEEVATFDALMADEIFERNEMFLPGTYIQLRVDGRNADEITYDECHAIR